MGTAHVPPTRRSSSASSWAAKNHLVATSDNGAVAAANGSHAAVKPPASNPQMLHGEDRTVKKLRLSKAWTVPDNVTVSDLCHRMARRRAGAVMLTDSDGLLSGIVTDKDIATRVIAEGLKPEQTIVAKIMTRNPVFVTMDTLAIDALHEMVQGKFRHLPVVENGEAVALLDITKCLYDAISRMERAAEQGSAIAAAVQGVERQWGSDFCGAHHAFIETLRERMFKPSLSTIISVNTKVAVVSPSDSVHFATRLMREYQTSSVVVMVGDRAQGILSSRDVLMRVIACNLSPDLVTADKVMTTNPECATIDTTILDALHIMQEGKFLHLPVLDNDEHIIACVDVLQITHAAISLVDGGPESADDMAINMIQKFWTSALSLQSPEEEDDVHSEYSASNTSKSAHCGKVVFPFRGHATSFAYKFEDPLGHMHRFDCSSKNLGELRASVMKRLAPESFNYSARLLYVDDEGDKILLETDTDLVLAVNHALSDGRKALKLHLDNSDRKNIVPRLSSHATTFHQAGRPYLQLGVLAGAFLLAGIGVMVYWKKAKL